MFGSSIQSGIPKSEYSFDLWLTCVAHGITPYGENVNEKIFVRDGQTRDVFNHGVTQPSFYKGEPKTRPPIRVEYACRNKPPKYLSACKHREESEGYLSTYHLADPTIICEKGPIECSSPLDKIRLTICGDADELKTAYLVPPPVRSEYANAVRHWLRSQKYSDKQAETILKNGELAVCIEAVRWVIGNCRLVGAYDLYPVLVGILKTRLSDGGAASVHNRLHLNLPLDENLGTYNVLVAAKDVMDFAGNDGLPVGNEAD
jgi:hypothetical protein